MNPAIAMPEAPRKGRGRLQLLLILAIAIGPMFLASAMYQWRFWVPETRSYHGVLIGDGRSLLRTEWFLTALPGAAIALTVLSLNLVGDGLNDILNPRSGLA